MPLLEAPAEYLESSPDHSLQAELPLLLAPPGPAALAQVRMPPPEVRLNQQNRAQQQQRTPFNRRPLGRRNSFDRDVPITEETQHLPAFVHLLPVVLPQQAPEPTLDELLVGQNNCMPSVKHIRIKSYVRYARLRLGRSFNTLADAPRDPANRPRGGGIGAPARDLLHDQPVPPVALPAAAPKPRPERQCAELAARPGLRTAPADPAGHQQLRPEQFRWHQRAAGHPGADRRRKHDPAGGSPGRTGPPEGAEGEEQPDQRAGPALLSGHVSAAPGGGVAGESCVPASALPFASGAQCAHVATAGRKGFERPRDSGGDRSGSIAGLQRHGVRFRGGTRTPTSGHCTRSRARSDHP
ncbi:translation initiation factor IF-2 isoform X2 [Drosophila elegans]|uniref:translation initiation factor IF-2 isoform X2 n=1 Tax=Drosophila elegans TaxID=30023 RepID=UPI001BC8369E|nr:translation initiation factor IF-2 isoform X2 [Drosophila elegans]